MTIAEFVNKVGFKVKEQDVQKVNQTISNIKGTATRILGTIGIGLSLGSMNQLIEEFSAVNDSIRSSIDGMGEMNEIQQLILNGANEARANYGDMAGTVTNLLKASKDLFQIDEAVAFSSALTKLMKTAGRNDGVISSVIEGFNKSFQKGIVDSETLNKMLEQAPETANILAEYLGVAKTQLIDMATSGALKVTDLKDAFLNASADINEAFGNVGMKVSDALKRIRNQWGLWLLETDQTIGITKTVSKTIVSASGVILGWLVKLRSGVVWLSDKLGGMNNAMKLIGITAGALFVSLRTDAIIAFLGKAGTLLTAISAKGLIIAAVITAVLLVIDDLVSFLKGNGSYIEQFFATIGVNAEAMRSQLIGAMEQCRKSLSSAFSEIKRSIGTAFVALLPSLKAFIEMLISLVTQILPVLCDLISLAATLFADIAQYILPMLGKFLGEIISLISDIAVIILPVLIKLLRDLLPPISEIVMSILPLAEQLLRLILPILTIVIKSILPVLVDLIDLCMPIIGILRDILVLLSPIIELLATLLSNRLKPLISILELVAESFSGKFGGAIKTVTTLLKPLFNILSSIMEFMEGIVGFASEKLGKITNTVGDWAGGIAGKVGNVVSGASQASGGFLSTAKEKVGSFIGGAVESIKNSSVGKAVGGFVSKAKGAVSNGLKKIGSFFGLAQGGYIGANNPTPVVIGDNTQEGEIVSPISKMRNTVLDALSAFARTTSPTQAAHTLTSASVRNSSTITQNIEINNKFEGDRAGQQKSSQAMEKAANDCTAELARGLAFAK